MAPTLKRLFWLKKSLLLVSRSTSTKIGFSVSSFGFFFYRMKRNLWVDFSFIWGPPSNLISDFEMFPIINFVRMMAYNNNFTKWHNRIKSLLCPWETDWYSHPLCVREREREIERQKGRNRRRETDTETYMKRRKEIQTYVDDIRDISMILILEGV